MKAAEALTRISFKNILYATDFSPVSEAALPFAIELSKQFGAKLHGLHVRMPSPSWFTGAEAFSQLIVTERERAERDATRLDGLLATVPHTVTVAEGDIWEPLSKLIQAHDVDLVIIGTHGRTGVSKAVLGSIAAEIFRSVPCPVLTIGPRCVASTGRKPGFKNILYAVDFSQTALHAAPFALSLAQEYQARLTLLTVLDRPAPGDLVIPELLSDSTRRRLHELVPADVELWCKPDCVVITGDPAEQILKIAQERSADLIILGAKEARGLLTTATHLAHATAQHVAAMAPCPVLTLKEVEN